jgi:hypothetical protein
MNLQLALQERTGEEGKAASKKNVVMGDNAWIGDSVINFILLTSTKENS